MARQHAPRFLRLVEEAGRHVREVTVEDVKPRIDRGDRFHLVDVREESEWASGHLPKAIHLGRGVIERDIEQAIPDTHAEIVVYCGGGFRSILAAESLQKMGYDNVWSISGGVRAWRESGFPIEPG